MARVGKYSILTFSYQPERTRRRGRWVEEREIGCRDKQHSSYLVLSLDVLTLTCSTHATINLWPQANLFSAYFAKTKKVYLSPDPNRNTNPRITVVCLKHICRVYKLKKKPHTQTDTKIHTYTAPCNSSFNPTIQQVMKSSNYIKVNRHVHRRCAHACHSRGNIVADGNSNSPHAARQPCITSSRHATEKQTTKGRRWTSDSHALRSLHARAVVCLSSVLQSSVVATDGYHQPCILYIQRFYWSLKPTSSLFALLRWTENSWYT